MQIRFCLECDYKQRDDDFEINRATHKGIGEIRCPRCNSWLWSIVFYDNEIEVNDWDENCFHLSKKDMKKLLNKIEEIINE